MAYHSIYEALTAARERGYTPGLYNPVMGCREWTDRHGTAFVIGRQPDGFYDFKPAKEVPSMCFSSGGDEDGNSGGECQDDDCACKSEAWADLEEAIADGGGAPADGDSK